MDDAYATSFKPVDSRGLVDYSPEATDRLYDFVEDNDDQDRHPDQKRFFQGGLVPPQSTALGGFQVRSDGVPDPAVFPWVRRKRRLHLRLQSEQQRRPGEFLPPTTKSLFCATTRTGRSSSLALISTTTVGPSALKTTICPTIPTRRTTGATTLTPAWRSTRKSASRPAICVRICDKLTAKITPPTVSLLLNGIGPVAVGCGSSTCSRRPPTPSPIRCRSGLYATLEFGAAGQTSGQHIAVPDLLAAEDTWINTFYTEWQYASPRRWKTKHRFKWDWWHQRDAVGRNGRETSGFVGLIDKIDGVFAWGAVEILPRFKSEFLSQSPFSLAERRRRSWDGIGSLLVRFPVMRDSELELGLSSGCSSSCCRTKRLWWKTC